MAVVTLSEDDVQELRDELRKYGHNVRVDVTTDDDGAEHIHIHIEGPLWWYVMRWLLMLPLTLPRRALASLEDQIGWHRIRGHDVSDQLIVGEQIGPLHMYDHYCHTCDMAW